MAELRFSKEFGIEIVECTDRIRRRDSKCRIWRNNLFGRPDTLPDRRIDNLRANLQYHSRFLLNWRPIRPRIARNFPDCRPNNARGMLCTGPNHQLRGQADTHCSVSDQRIPSNPRYTARYCMSECSDLENTHQRIVSKSSNLYKHCSEADTAQLSKILLIIYLWGSYLPSIGCRPSYYRRIGILVFASSTAHNDRFRPDKWRPLYNWCFSTEARCRISSSCIGRSMCRGASRGGRENIIGRNLWRICRMRFRRWRLRDSYRWGRG